MPYEDELQNDPVGLAKKYSFFPLDAARNFDHLVDTKRKALKGDFEGFHRSNVNSDKKIARITLEIEPSGRGEVLKVKPTVGGAAGVPAYFLPWDEKGAAVRMTIPDSDPNLPVDQHPRVFFTAVLSGCSIIFKGTDKKPTVYHCGTGGTGSGGTPTNKDNKADYTDSNDFFKKMLTGEGKRKVEAIINSTDYMLTKTGGADVGTMENKFLRAIKSQDQFKKGFIVKSVISWGVCFGVRNGWDWKFYLQQNGIIVYDTYKFVDTAHDVEKKTLLGTKTVTVSWPEKVVRAGKTVSRPILVQKVFPGHGTAKMGSSWDLLTL